MMNKNIKLLFLLFILIIVGIFLFKKTEKMSYMVCPDDVKICSDGSSVGRTGSKCEFAECPVVQNQTFAITLYFQDKEVAIVSDCRVTLPKTINIDINDDPFEVSLKELFKEELSRYGEFDKYEFDNDSIKVYLKSDQKIVGLSSCEVGHLMSVLNDTLTQYEEIKKVELYSTSGKIEF
jgi:hypothetical protein